MRWRTTACLVALSLASTELPAFAQKGGRGMEQGSKFGWLASLTEGKAQAKKSGKPLMVVLRCVP